MKHVFIDPGGLGEYGLLLIIEAPTGVTYEQQCGGCLTELKNVEGFLIPIGSQADAAKVYDWFWRTFQGHCYRSLKGGSPWTSETISQLRQLVAEIRCFYAKDGADEVDTSYPLQLDESRMDECIEAWIPVITPYGKAVLTLRNSD